MAQEGPSLFGTNNLTAAARRKRMAKAKLVKGEDPDVVTLKLPKLVLEGRNFEPLEMKVKSAKNPVDGVSIELTHENLEYVRAAMLTQGTFVAPRRRKKPDVSGTASARLMS